MGKGFSLSSVTKKEAALGVEKLNSCLRQTCNILGDFHSLELFYTLTIMWITKHFDSKVKPYEDLSVSQDFVEPYVTEQNLSLKAGHMW